MPPRPPNILLITTDQQRLDTLSCLGAPIGRTPHLDALATRGGVFDCCMIQNPVCIPTLAVTCQRNIDALSDQPWQTEEMALAQPIHRAGVRLAHEIGVKLGVGTDYPGTPRTWRLGDRTLHELQELVACGLSPLEALTAATQVNAAAYRKLDRLGTLAPGKLADLLVVSGNPADEVSLLYDQRHLCLVVKEGRVEYADDAHRQFYRIADE